jgi:hypothetical protein
VVVVAVPDAVPMVVPPVADALSVIPPVAVAVAVPVPLSVPLALAVPEDEGSSPHPPPSRNRVRKDRYASFFM